MGWTAPTFPAVANDGAIGVLGQSLNGPGVRGHGGPLQRLTPETTMTIATPMQANPGGIFSSGRRQYIEISGTPSLHQEVSPDSFPQLRLVPSFDPKLPEAGKIGDLFLQVQDPGIAATAQLWICTGYITDQGPDIQPKTLWRPVLMGNPLPGGTKAPPPVAFPPT
jgi:hypothetical protein